MTITGLTPQANDEVQAAAVQVMTWKNIGFTQISLMLMLFGFALISMSGGGKPAAAVAGGAYGKHSFAGVIFLLASLLLAYPIVVSFYNGYSKPAAPKPLSAPMMRQMNSEQAMRGRRL